MNNLGKMMDGFTLKFICAFANIKVPEKFSGDSSFKFSTITCSGAQCVPNCAFFERGLLENGTPAPDSYKESAARRAYANGAKFLFCSRQYLTNEGNPLPCIIVEDPRRLFISIMATLRNSYSSGTNVTAITGSVGKTTTKEMLTLVASSKFKTLFSRENANGFASIAKYMQQVNHNTEVYIQEAGAFFPGLVESEAYMLKPNSVVITNVGMPHIDLYGSVENILYDKLSLLRYMKPGGMAFLNYDDPMIRNCTPDCNVTWFSAENTNADFYAENIVFADEFMEFDISGKCSTTHIKLNTFGIHNIINSVAAFAYGYWMGIPEKDIAAALSSYKAVGLRQNLVNIGGYQLYVDCYNSAPNSVVGAVQTAIRIPVEDGNKRIIVFGDIPRMGAMAPKIHGDCGKQIAKYGIDLYLLYGPNMAYMAEELRRAGRNVLHTCSRDQLNLWLAQNMKLGDLILFKAGHPSHLAKTVDQVYGTSYHITDGDVILDSGRNFETERFTGKIVDGMAEIRSCKDASEEMKLPAYIQDRPLVRIGDDSFSRSRKLQRLVIPEGVTNIGVGAFYICTNLKSVVFPSTLKVLERSAFNYCVKLEDVTLPDSVIHIGRRAFYDCKSLRKIFISRNTTFIGSEAFTNCTHLTIYGFKGSFAEKYAADNGIPFNNIENNS